MNAPIQNTGAPNLDSFAEEITLPPGQKFVFRTLKRDDTALLDSYFRSLSDATRRCFGPHPFTTEVAEKLCAETDHNNKIIRLVAVTGGARHPEIAAYFILALELFNSDLERYRARGTNFDPASVCSIAPSVTDAWQDRGLGRVMMERTVSVIRRLGRSLVILQGGVRADNPRAIHFYEKFGFRKVASFTVTVESFDMVLNLADKGSNT